MPEGRYLYCVAPGGHHPPADLRGLEGKEVRCLEHRGLALWVSEAERRPTPSLDRIRSHHAVVRSAMREEATPVPVRFGQWFRSRDDLLEAIDEERDRYGELLDRLHGTREHGVRVLERNPKPLPEEAPAANGESGREYMEELARREAEVRAARDRGRRIGDALGSHLGGLVREERVELLESREGLVSVAHLVADADGERYRSEVERFAADHGDLDFRVTGPWPPYSFVT